MKNIVIIIILLLCGSSYAEIRQKIDKDGNLVFYNVNKKAVVKTSNTSGKKYENSYERMIAAASMNTGVDAKLINCIIKVESNYNPKAISKAGAVGLMQLMPETASYYDVVDLTNPLENINAGTRHFAHLLNYFNGDIPLALAAYNAGLSRVNKQKKIPPIKETIDYVNKIMLMYNGTSGYEEQSRKIYVMINSSGEIEIKN